MTRADILASVALLVSLANFAMVWWYFTRDMPVVGKSDSEGKPWSEYQESSLEIIRMASPYPLADDEEAVDD